MESSIHLITVGVTMENIFIIDDSKTIQLQVRSLAQHLVPNLNVVASSSGEEALSLMTTLKDPVYLAIIDYNMHGMNGIELAKKLTNRIDHQRMVLCTTNIQESVYKSATRQGLLLIEKPITKEKFQAIMEHINRQAPSHQKESH